MVFTVPLGKFLGSAFGFLAVFALVLLPIVLVGTYWQWILGFVALSIGAFLVAVSVIRSREALRARRPGTSEHRIAGARRAAYEFEIAVQAELGAAPRIARRAAGNAARTAGQVCERDIAAEQVVAEARQQETEQANVRNEALAAAEFLAAEQGRRALAEERVNRSRSVSP